MLYSGGNQKPPYPFPDKAAHQKREMKNRRTEPLLNFDGAFRSCQTTEMTPAVLIYHRVSLLTCVRRASLSASDSLPSHGGYPPRNGGLSSSGMTVSGRTHAHSTVRVGMTAYFIFGLLPDRCGSLRDRSRTMMFIFTFRRKYNALFPACQALFFPRRKKCLQKPRPCAMVNGEKFMEIRSFGS